VAAAAAAAAAAGKGPPAPTRLMPEFAITGASAEPGSGVVFCRFCPPSATGSVSQGLSRLDCRDMDEIDASCAIAGPFTSVSDSFFKRALSRRQAYRATQTGESRAAILQFQYCDLSAVSLPSLQR
jgi:hypothetical protein